MTKKKPNGYWKSLENTVAEAMRVMGEQGWRVLPPARELAKNGYSSLNTAISRHHGGLNKFRTKLGQRNPRKARGYWENLDNTIAEAQQAMQEQEWETLPSSNQLQKHGYSSLSSAITKYHGGHPTFKTTLGQQNTKKPRGFWQQEENTITEARKAMKEQEWTTLPSNKELQKHGYSSLSSAINKYHGGHTTFRTTLGQTNTTKPQGYWKKEENVIAEATKAMKEQGWDTLPPQVELKKNGYASLNTAISRHHGGLNKFRTKLGQQNRERPKGYWQSLENTLSEARKAIKEQGWGTLPSHETLKEHGYSPLGQAISKYYGGIHNFRKLFTEHQTGKTPKQQLEELLDVYIAA